MVLVLDLFSEGRLMLSSILPMRITLSRTLLGQHIISSSLLSSFAFSTTTIMNASSWMSRLEGGIPPLVELLEFADSKVQRAAAGALRTLAFKNDVNKNQVITVSLSPTAFT